MGDPQSEESSSSSSSFKMEGWLYLIRSNRIGLQNSRKRYFILKDCLLKSFKSLPVSDNEEPIRSAAIDSCIRVTDNGRECIQRKVFFIFSLYNTSNLNDQLKLGASSPEEAARWIRSLQDAAAKERRSPATNYGSCSKKRWSYFGMCAPSRKHDLKLSIDWTIRSSMHTEAMTSDVIAPSPWKIFGCQNGLRLFKEAKDWDSRGRHREWDDHPAIMAVGVVDGTSEAIFQTLMSMGQSRFEWDFSYYRGSVVEHHDGHTDIIHEQLESDWLPWGMKKRDFLCQRYWRREDDGTYVILYHSVFHNKCRSVRGYVRACLKSGGYVISPIDHGKQSLVKHMLSVNWKSWRLYVRPASARAITIRMLEKIAALREMFKSKSSGGDSTSREIQSEEIKIMEVVVEENIAKEDHNETDKASRAASLIGMQDAADEFFDVPEPNDYDHLDNESWSSKLSPQHQSSSSLNNMHQTRFTSAACLVKKLHDLAVQKKGYMDLQDQLSREEESTICCYGATLQNDSSCSYPCTWATADPRTFLIRGDKYLEDNRKIKATGTLTQMVGADWLRSEKREDDLAGRPGGIVKQAAERGGPEFFFVVNIQVPAGTTTYSLALYYMMRTPLEENPLLHRFVNEDDAFRNSRFKLIPYISKGSWIVKQSVGKKACLVGQALEINYFRGKNYLELDVDVGSSTVARGVVSLVLGYLNNLVIEMAFLVQANTAEELPEYLIGTCRINHLDALKSVPVEN